MRLRMAGLLLALALLGCGGQGGRDLGRDTAHVVSDTNVLKEAQAAVDDVLRNADDCEAAKAALPAANRALEEAAGRVQTATGRVSLDALRTRVKTVAQNCP